MGGKKDGEDRVNGGHGLGDRNAEGENVVDFAHAYDIVIANTYFCKRTSHLVTYSSGGKETQIDHILVRRSSLKDVVNCTTLPSASISTQHRVLMAKLMVTIYIIVSLALMVTETKRRRKPRARDKL